MVIDMKTFTLNFMTQNVLKTILSNERTVQNYCFNHYCLALFQACPIDALHLSSYIDTSTHRSTVRLRELRARIYDRACVRARIYMRMRLHLREFAFVYTQKCKRSFLRAYACICMHAFACVRLRACLCADLIKMQNKFARKIFQHSNALWVQKLSGCTIEAGRCRKRKEEKEERASNKQ